MDPEIEIIQGEDYLAIEAKADGKFAIPATADHPGRLPINDKGQIQGAITCVVTGSFRGNALKPPLTDDEKAEARRNIEAAIHASDESEDWKQQELDRLHGKGGDKKGVESLVTIDLAVDVSDYTTAIKSLGDDRFGGYGVLWGSPAAKDLTGEYFTPETDFGVDLHLDPELPNVRIPFLYHHGLDPLMGFKLMGTIDKLEKDSIGVWFEGQWNKRQQYVKHVKELADKGALGYSSGSMSHQVKKARDGRIEKWPLYELSGTTQPAEPRGTDIVPFSRLDPTTKHYVMPQAISPAYKALNIPTNRLGLQDDAPGHTQDSVRRDNATPPGSTDKTIRLKDKEGFKMELTPEQLQAQIDAAVKARMDADEAAKKAEVDRQTAIKTEAQTMFDAWKKESGLKGLPMPDGSAAPADKPNAEVIGDTRYAGLSSQDMAFMTDLMGVLAGTPNAGQAGTVARQFSQNFVTDTSRRFQREMSAKAIKEHKADKLSDLAVAYLPFKSLEAVEANDYKAPAIKANELDNTSITNQGAEWVPTIWSAELWSRVRISNPVASNIDTIDMPSNPYNIPLQSNDPTVYYTGEAANATDLVFQGGIIAVSQVKTDKAALTAKKLTARAVLSTELNEDSIIPILPDFRAQTIRALQNYIDDTVLNGDTVTTASTNINLIDGTPAAAPNQPAYIAFNGFRKYALITNTAQAISVAGGPTLALFRKLRFTLQPQYAVDVPNLVCIVDTGTYQKMLALPEFSTYMNAGVLASNLLGVLPGGSTDTVAQAAFPVGVIDGVRVFVSAQLGLSQTSDGKISTTASNNVAGTMVMYHRSRWKLGFRRQIQLETFTSPFLGDTIQVMGSCRVGLASFDTKSAALLYNINLA